MKTIITKSDIISALAAMAIKQSPYTFPRNLQAALGEVGRRIDELGLFKSTEKREYASYLEMQNEHIYTLVNDLIKQTPEVAIWNVTKYEQDMGITDPNDPNRPVKFGFVSRDSGPKADFDFIDLDALCRNVVNMLIPIKSELVDVVKEK